MKRSTPKLNDTTLSPMYIFVKINIFTRGSQLGHGVYLIFLIFFSDFFVGRGRDVYEYFLTCEPLAFVITFVDLFVILVSIERGF